MSTEADIVDQAQEVLGDRNAFDHLALILKAGNGYVVYDFDFNILAPQFLGAEFNYETPYTFSGSWSTADLGNKGLSHLSVWARDPIPEPGESNEAPAPASLALLGIGLSALALLRRRKY